MTKLVLVSVSAFAGALFAIVFLEMPLALRAGPEQLTASENGDVNGDSQLDIADVIYTLVHLFKGGPPPVACADSPELVRRVEALEAADAGVAEALADVANALREFRAMPCRERRALPDTGLTKCYGQNAEEIPCNSPTLAGQDGFYSTGCPPQGRFVDNGDGTVTDNCTGLMWQKNTADSDGDGQLTESDYFPWSYALAYCENLSLAGHDDWRLPNIRELQSIFDYGRFGPMIDPVFGAVSSRAYLSSTPFLGNPRGVLRYEWGWTVYFFQLTRAPDSDKVDADGLGAVRAVRTVQ